MSTWYASHTSTVDCMEQPDIRVGSSPQTELHNLDGYAIDESRCGRLNCEMMTVLEPWLAYGLGLLFFLSFTGGNFLLWEKTGMLSQSGVVTHLV